MTINPTPTQYQIASSSCALFASALGALIGSHFPSDVGDLRYGGAGLGVFIGLLLYSRLFTLTLNAAIPIIRPPSHVGNQQEYDEYKSSVTIMAVILMIIFGLVGFGVLVNRLLIDGHLNPGSATMAVVLASAFGGSLVIRKIRRH